MKSKDIILKAQQLMNQIDAEDKERAACIRHQIEGHELSDRCKALIGRTKIQSSMKLQHNIDFPKIPGVDLYLVGGAVRDMIMGKKPKDEDFVMLTNYDYNQVVQQLQAAGVTIFQLKPEFQIIIMGIRDKDNPKKVRGVDLVFPRREGAYSDGRRPDVTERTNELKEDSARRDFTINSMYMDGDGNVFDYFSGMDDIKNKVVRAVGNPDERFKEDALRILRAMRFACKLGFSIEPQTYESMVRNIGLLSQPSIAVDRVREELNKMLQNNPDMAMKFILDFGLNNIIRQKDPQFKYEMVQSGIKS